MSDAIELKSIHDLKGMNFYIPKYQRGYRWTEQQVLDLLNDIKEFIDRKPSDHEIYCLQPLVVKKRNEETFRKIKEEAKTLHDVETLLKGSWDVIDGQQRLTTIKILLIHLTQDYSYSIEYETRNGSKDFLNDICNKNEDDANDIDFYHMWRTKKTLDMWFAAKDEDYKKIFFDILQGKVKFIWYESKDQDPISVFTRLNIGKIPLTDAELIKALFLNQSNFSNIDNAAAIRLYQQEIAAEWDNIEYTLQDDEFWLFIHSLEWNKPTRIDFIFDLMQEKNVLELSKDLYGKIGCDEHKSFRYFYEYFKFHQNDIDGKTLRDDIWRKVKEYFQIFQEWYNDLELYHYIGYLIENGWVTTGDLIKIWKEKSKKEDFVAEIKSKIREKLPKEKPLTQEYEISGHPKTQCRPLLLLFNIQLVIDQNKELASSDKYQLGAFYKFPFHLFKKEGRKANGKGWEIEHIASNAGDDLTKLESQKIYLAGINYVFKDSKLKETIDTFIEKGKEENFDGIYTEVQKMPEFTPIPEDKKNYIWNFALLDSTTNEEYQNSPFPIKRICVLAKERGQKATLKLEGGKLKITYEKGIAFVPPCTRNVFTKAYTDIPTALNAWTTEDAGNYLRKMNEVLSTAGFIEDQTGKISTFIEDFQKSAEVNNG